MLGRTTLSTCKFELAKDVILPAGAVTEKLVFIGRTGSGKTYAAQKLAEEFLGAGAQVVILDPVGNWWGLRLAAGGQKPGINILVLGGLHGDVPLEPTSGKLVADLITQQGISVILDVSMMRKGQRKEFATELAEELVHNQKSRRSPLHVFLEEAQVFVPQRTDHGEARMLGAFEDLVKLGRNFGIGTSLISQRPQAVNKDVLNQAELLICLQLTGPQERKAIETWVYEKGADESLMAELPKLPVGTAVIWSPAWLSIFKRVKISAKWTYDASSTPKFGHVEKVSELAPIDIESIREAMASVVARVEESDPKKLKERIRQLELKHTAGMDPKMEAALKKELQFYKTAYGTLLESVETIRRDIEQHQSSIGKLASRLPRKSEGPMPASGQLWSTPPPAWNGTEPGSASTTKTQTQRFQKTGKELAVYETTKTKLRQAVTIRDIEEGGLVAGARRMLQILAIWKPWTLSRKQVATLSGMSRSGTFNTYLSKLRTLGYIEERNSDIMATDAGIAVLGGDVPSPPTTAELLEQWIPKLGGAGAGRMLTVLVEHYPTPMSRTELAARCGLTKSGTFNTYLSKLRTNGLLSEHKRGYVKAADVLFIIPGGKHGTEEAQQ
jgi:hypothetical protein